MASQDDAQEIQVWPTSDFVSSDSSHIFHKRILHTNNIIMAKEQSSIRERQRIDLREPRRYTVTIYNDDFTTMEFVVMILKQIFFKSEAEAEALMLQVHHSDKAVVGIYSYDVATSKVRKATNMAREAGFPLRLTVEPEK